MTIVEFHLFTVQNLWWIIRSGFKVNRLKCFNVGICGIIFRPINSIIFILFSTCFPNSGPGQLVCYLCEPGSVKENPGSGSCEVCLAGYECPDTATSKLVFTHALFITNISIKLYINGLNQYLIHFSSYLIRITCCRNGLFGWVLLFGRTNSVHTVSRRLSMLWQNY